VEPPAFEVLEFMGRRICRAEEQNLFRPQARPCRLRWYSGEMIRSLQKSQLARQTRQWLSPTTFSRNLRPSAIV